MRYVYISFILIFSSLFAGCGTDPEPVEDSYVIETFQEGWYGEEGSEGNTWRWADGHASISLYNLTPEPRLLIVNYDIHTPLPRTLKLSLNDSEVANEEFADDTWRSRKMVLNLEPGMNTFAFDTKEAGYTPQGDTRDLHFCLRNFEFKSVEDGDQEALMLQLPRTFEDGWYEFESDKYDQWRWSSGHASIVIENKTNETQHVSIEYGLRSLTPRSVTVSLGGAEYSTVKLESDLWAPVVVDAKFEPGLSTLTLDTAEPGTTPPGDTRNLHFCLRNFEIKKPEPVSE